MACDKPSPAYFQYLRNGTDQTGLDVKFVDYEVGQCAFSYNKPIEGYA